MDQIEPQSGISGPNEDAQEVPRDQHLARAVAGGDRKALGALYEEYSDSMYAVAHRLTGSSADAWDAVHDVFAALPKWLKGFTGSRLGSWLRTATARRALMQLRTLKRRSEVALPEDLAVPRDSAAFTLDLVALDRALASLPKEQYLAIVLKEVYGYSHDEIGQQFDVPSSTSRGRVYEARSKLREELKGE